MKKHAIIPIFIPHAGCPHDCVFCNQKAITARNELPGLSATVETIERNLAGIRKNPSIETVEIAFFGGSFTGIPLDDQSAYLEIAHSYKKKGLIDLIHMSTRPDYINREILDNLKKYDADIIELGVQSFDPDVLRLSARGHSPEAVSEASALIKEYGFTLGIQLMIGLPGDSYEKCMYSVAQTIKLEPELARIYPTVVLEDTALYEMTKKGTYTPLTQAEAVAAAKDMYRELTRAGITILRVGLKSTDIIRPDDGAVSAGTYHPAFRQLVEAEIAKEDLEAELTRLVSDGRLPGRDPDSSLTDIHGHLSCAAGRIAVSHQPKVTFCTHPESFSNMIGNRRSNRIYFEEKYPWLRIRFATDASLKRGTYKVCTDTDS